jgi:hypothetical protein
MSRQETRRQMAALGRQSDDTGRVRGPAQHLSDGGPVLVAPDGGRPGADDDVRASRCRRPVVRLRPSYPLRFQTRSCPTSFRTTGFSSCSAVADLILSMSCTRTGPFKRVAGHGKYAAGGLF